MAKFVICAVRDKAVNAFMQPFFARSEGEAIRSFGDAVADPKMEFGKHPEDYNLWCFGSWDDKGEFVTWPDPVKLGEASSYVIEYKNT